MKRRILALVVALALVALVVPAAVFSAEDTVSCTVSAVLVSVTVADGNVAYGTLASGAMESTKGLGDTQTATNDGNVAEDFKIKSSEAIGVSQNWTLAGTIGENQFKHEFSPTQINPIDPRRKHQFINLHSLVIGSAS